MERMGPVLVEQSDVVSLDDPARQWLIWQEEGTFTKNPDIVPLPDGRLLGVFNACDAHWPREFTRITLIESRDRGRTWGRARVIAAAFPGRGEERWVTPRLTRLRNGRLFVVCDQNDYRHCHEDQPPGIYAWWSDDDGETWDGPHPTGIPGIEPDHVVELADGTLLCGTHFMRARTQKLTEAVLRSADGGRTWGEMAIIAGDAVHNYCEGAIVPLASGRLVCVMRENNHMNYPSYLAFSDDAGRTWSRPVEAPFAGDRPFAGQLPDGRTLVTFRNQAGRPGLSAWLGDIEREHGYKVARAGAGAAHTVIHQHIPADLPTVPVTAGATRDGDALVLTNGLETVTRYLILPPESFTSGVRFTAEVQLEGEDGVPAATVLIARVGLHLTLFPDGLRIHVNQHRAIDLRQRRSLDVTHRGGLIEVRVDGEIVASNLVYRETVWERSFFGNGPDHRGAVHWFAVSYATDNPTEPPHRWEWQAASRTYPNQYAIDRWRELDYNPTPNPDHGYSTWVQFEDGEIFVADYTNEGAPAGKAALRGYSLHLSDFAGE
jgi:hypothetical protein